jgi:hypothetical protein
MLIKLTHRGTPTLVNVDQIVSIYQDIDLKSGLAQSKVTTTNGVVFVEESLNVIHKLVWQIKNGQAPDMDYVVPTIEDRMERSFNQDRPLSYTPTSHRQRTPMRRNYNPHNFQEYNNY